MSSPLPSVMLVIFWQGQSLYLFPMTKLSGRSRYSQLQSSLVAFIRSQDPRLRELRDLLLVKSQTRLLVRKDKNFRSLYDGSARHLAE